MTNHEIYKIYKHGGSLEGRGFTAKRIYRALKDNLLQVVLVKDEDDKEVVFNYVPETGKFYRMGP